MEMEEALRRGAARLAGQSERLLARARSLAGQGAGSSPAAGPEPGPPAGAEARASRAALGASHALLSEAIALLTRPR